VYKTIGAGNNDQTLSFIVFPDSGCGAADQGAVGRMNAKVREFMGKLADADDSLGVRLADDEFQYREINMALNRWGGPDFRGREPTAGRKPVTRIFLTAGS